MAEERATDRVWEIADDISICMLITQQDGDIRARPMGAYLRPEENAVYFLTDVRRHKDDEIARNPNVCIAFADADGQKYVAISGHAELSDDRTMIRELWSTPAKAWWDSPQDPNIRILKVTPKDAEFWDSPGTVVSYVKMAAAAMTGTRPALGENRKVSM